MSSKEIYTVYIDRGPREKNKTRKYRLGAFNGPDGAKSACKKIVDGFLLSSYKPGMTGEELFLKFTSFGPVPSMVSGENVRSFSARRYARQRSKKICGEDGSDNRSRKEQDYRKFLPRTIADLGEPLLAAVQRIDHRVPDDIVSDIYAINITDRTFLVTAQADYSVTVNEETGEALEHGSGETQVALKPKSFSKVGDVAGWELDSALRFELLFKGLEEKDFERRSFNLKDSYYHGQLPLLGVVGFIFLVHRLKSSLRER